MTEPSLTNSLWFPETSTICLFVKLNSNVSPFFAQVWAGLKGTYFMSDWMMISSSSDQGKVFDFSEHL